MKSTYAIVVAAVLLLPANVSASGPRECDIDGTCAQTQPQGEVQPIDDGSGSASPQAPARSQARAASTDRTSDTPSRVAVAEEAPPPAAVPPAEVAPPANEQAAYPAPPRPEAYPAVQAASESQDSNSWQWAVLLALAGATITTALWLDYSKPKKFKL